MYGQENMKGKVKIILGYKLIIFTIESAGCIWL